MKYYIVALISALAWGSSANTGEMVEKNYLYYVGGHIGHAEMDGSHPVDGGNELKRGPFFGGEFGMRPFSNDHIELRFRVEHSQLDVADQKSDESAMWYAADVLYFLNNNYNYIFIGPHYQDFDSNSQTGAQLGLGARYHFTPEWAMTGEVQGLYGFDDETTDFMASIGIQYFFGSKSVPSSFSDDDQDGVANHIDDCLHTPAGYSVDNTGCTLFREQAIVEKVTVHFENDSAEVPASYYNNVADIADFMKQHPQLNIVVEGHTSLVGSEQYNQRLSERRAEAVKDILIHRYQTDASRVSTMGYGETQPLVEPETSAKDEAENRRIMVEMSVKEAAPISQIEL
ncbi:OmpA family protein [Echinimonas agarilytica]|uniref:OmpA family protein n=1 Tax=Echinimonas agarilytica TaxID=1215918 RepID=A0AA41W8E3_9GAMM|nr:OmpA family protein [Echinimonas agarilytica]MCM2680328.1 OmpA family protein [Echinimonas agarilytica]